MPTVKAGGVEETHIEDFAHVTKTARTRLDGLQVLRFAAAFLVLFGHLVHEGETFGFLPQGAEAALAFFPWQAGVDIFFVISGFIMFHVTSREFGQAGAQGRFLTRRFTRLVPLYWLFSAAMLAAIAIFPGRIANASVDPAHIGASFAFVPWLNAKGMVQPILALGWTLNYEMFFYALFSFALFLPRRTGVAAISILFTVLALVHLVVPEDLVQFRFWSDPIILEFVAGVLLAYAVSKGFSTGPRGAIALLVAGIGGLALSGFVPIIGPFARPILFGLPALLIVAGAAGSGFAAKSALGRSAVLGGDASYALYLSHPFTVNLAALVFGTLGMGWVFVPVTLVLAIGASIAVHLILEKPVTGWLNQRYANRAKPAADLVPIVGGGHFGGSTRDPALDMFRGIAILLVVLYHYTARLPYGELNMASAPYPPFGFGWIGVYFFFLISGYCIFLTLERSANVRLFLARRFSRIYPAFLAAVLVLFVFVLLAPVPSVPAANYHETMPTLIDVGLNLVFLGEIGQWINGSFWSIAVEVRFYLLIGVLAAVFGTGPRLVRLFSVLALVLTGIWALAVMVSPADARISAASLLRVFAIAPYLPFFAFGILLRQRQKQAMQTDVLLAATGTAMGLILFTQAARFSYSGAAGLNAAILVVGVFGALTWLFVRYSAGKTLPHIPVIGPALAAMGFMSYSWYLVHETVGLTLMKTLGPYVPAWIDVLIAGLATYAIAYIFAHSVEWRFRKQFEGLALRILNALMPFWPRGTVRKPAE